MENLLQNLLTLLDGKKTYIGGAIIFIAGGLYALKQIDKETFEMIVAFGGSVAIYGLRKAQAKLNDKIDTEMNQVKGLIR